MAPQKIVYPKYWDEGVRNLCELDPILSKIASRNKENKLCSHKNPFLTLVRAIIGQQISSTAARKISEKLLFLTSLESSILTRELQQQFNPSTFLRSTSTAKRIGISRSKYLCITDVANQIVGNPRYWEKLEFFSDTEILSNLLKIKGIGLWTGEMFLIFHLMRPNIFPKNDLGLLKSIAKNYSLVSIDVVRKKLPYLTRKWNPWNTIAAWYLWCDADQSPFIY